MESGFVEAAEELLADLYRRFPLSMRPRLEWRKFRTTAGIAYYRRNAIGLSRHVLTTEEQLRATLIHEYAHLLAVHRHGPKAANHGPAWQQAMADLGAPPVVRHNYQVKRNQPRQRAIYVCVACGAEFARRRRLPRGRIFVHAQCGGGLKLLRLEAMPTA